jgi:hypothetical protein
MDRPVMRRARLYVTTAVLPLVCCAQVYGPEPYGKGMYLVTATQPTCTRGHAEAETVDLMLKKANSFCEANDNAMVPVRRQDVGCRAELVFRCQTD